MRMLPCVVEGVCPKLVQRAGNDAPISIAQFRRGNLVRCSMLVRTPVQLAVLASATSPWRVGLPSQIIPAIVQRNSHPEVPTCPIK